MKNNYHKNTIEGIDNLKQTNYRRLKKKNKPKKGESDEEYAYERKSTT